MECKRYKIEDYKWTKLSVAKYTSDIICLAKEQIAECLQCEHNKNCDDKYNLIKKLDENVK